MEALLQGRPEPQQLLARVRHTDMRAFVEAAWRGFRQRLDNQPEATRKAVLCGAVAHFSERLRLNAEQDAVALNVTRVTSAADHLYSTSGYSIWFAPAGFEYLLRLFEREGDRLRDGRAVRVTPCAPLLVEGDLQVVALYPGRQAHLAFSLNLPVPGSDIEVFDSNSLARVAWFPADPQAARFLLLLEALQRIGDPHLGQVAGELIFHHHPAVRWQAFLVLMQHSPENLGQYSEILGSLANPGLDTMLAQYKAEGVA